MILIVIAWRDSNVELIIVPQDSQVTMTVATINVQQATPVIIVAHQTIYVGKTKEIVTLIVIVWEISNVEMTIVLKDSPVTMTVVMSLQVALMVGLMLEMLVVTW